jgi:molybdenum-dependent DNA-binding transcriptional regulator ModE
VKSAEQIMNMLDAYDLTGSLLVAGELAGVSHRTVARYVAVRDSGLAARGVNRPMSIDEFLPKVVSKPPED